MAVTSDPIAPDGDAHDHGHADSIQPLLAALSENPVTKEGTNVGGWTSGGIREIIPLYVAVFLYTVAVSVPVLVTQGLLLSACGDETTVAATYSALIGSTRALVSIVITPFVGAMSDVMGRKPLLLLFHATSLIATLLYARLASSITALFVAHVLFSTSSAYFVIARTAIFDVSERHELNLTSLYGYLGGVIGSSFLLGPLLGTLLEGHLYSTSSIDASLVFIMVATVYMLFFFPEARAPTTVRDTATSARAIVRELVVVARDTELNPLPRIRRFAQESHTIRWLALFAAVFAMGSGGIQSIIYLYGEAIVSWSVTDFGFFLSVCGLLILLVQGVLLHLVVRLFNEPCTLLMSMVIAAIGMLLYAFARSQAMLYVALVVSSLSFLYDPVMQGIVSRQTTGDKQGSLQGSFAAVTELVLLVNPILSNFLLGVGIQMRLIGLPFFFWAAISFLCAPFIYKAL